MAITLVEAAADIPAVITFIQKADGAIASLPKENAKPSDYIRLATAILEAAAPLADTIAEQAKS